MGKLSGLGQARVRKGGVYFLPGQYLVEITKVHMIQSRKREDMFIIETVVIESDVPGRPKGSRPSQLIKLSNDAAMGNIKSFLAAVMNEEDPDSIGEDEWEATGELVVSEENPLAGIRVYLNCVDMVTKSGGEFTLHNWGPLAATDAA